MPIERTCPDCGEELTLNFSNYTATCAHCGYRRNSLTGLDEKANQVKEHGPQHAVLLTHKGEIYPRARSAFYTGHDHLHRGNPEAALEAFQRALSLQPDFTDAHLWIAKLIDDEAAKREHLSFILANDPAHLEATREIMILNGDMTREEAERTHHYNDPELRQADEAVQAAFDTLECPVCMGDLTVHDDNNHVECKFCGYTATRPQPTMGIGATSLTAALLKRKAQQTKWVIGERLLHCNNCGAQRTIPGTKLSSHCPFCDSNQVIVQDALDSFEQPVGLIPFAITRNEAGEHIKKQLSTFGNRLRGIFDNNKVARATLNGYYLPFWIFDVYVQVTQTTMYYGGMGGGYIPAQRSEYSDAVYDIAVCGVTSPPQHLTAKLGAYNLKKMVAYDPQLLARYPAELYSIDFDKAALEARSIVAKQMREKYNHGVRRRSGFEDEREEEIQVSTMPQYMDFQLVLMPVWVVTLIEEDDDMRTALVNGQTGTVVLGKARKPQAR
ncbi:MAG: hypothetical protein CUN54_02870 [Phototrophicales bacterium]|nr:MAG: hypothetical protein CUN54_02870 [Phototrophicales bacterium]